MNQSLSGIKILDFSGPAGFYCSKLLADLGADVVIVENPSDELFNNLGPYYNDIKDPNYSLYRWHFHTNKKSVALNISNPKDKETLNSLIKHADVFIDTLTNQEANSLDLSMENVRALNPHIVHTRITGFPDNSEYSEYKYTDMTVLAMSGLMSITGFPEDPPNQMGGEQAYHMASLNAAIGTMISVLERELTGTGKDVSVSIQECASMSTLQTANFNYYTWHGINRGRNGLNHPFSDQGPSYEEDKNFPRVLYESKDGWVAHAAHLAPPGAWKNFVKWLSDYDSEQDLDDPKFENHETRNLFQNHINDVMKSHCAKLTKQEIYHSAQKLKILVIPINSVKDLTEDEQLIYRGYFEKVFHQDLNTEITYPGAPYQMKKTPWKIKSPAPKVGENTQQILNEWLNQ